MARQFSGRLLRAQRKKAGLTNEELAHALHPRRSVYSVHNYQNGRTMPSVEVLAALADVLGVRVDDFFEDVESEAPSVAA